MARIRPAVPEDRAAITVVLVAERDGDSVELTTVDVETSLG